MLLHFSSPLWIAVAGCFGALVGSFLNVCIVRLPREESIVTPRSRCPRCRTMIVWWENIPLVSFILLRGECRSCHRSISWRYPAVELLSALLAMLWWWRVMDPLSFFVFFCLLIAPLLVVTFIDLEHLIIPDVISLPGIGVGLLVRSLFAFEGDRLHAVTEGIVGAVVGGGILFVIAWGYEKLRKQEGMGGGDVKLAAMLGAFFGWHAALFILMMSSILGSIIGLGAVLLFGRSFTYAIPYGPFLAGAGLLYLFVGPALIDWYLGFFMALR